MANAPYKLGFQKFLDGAIAYSSDNIKLKGCSASYSPNLTTDEFFSDLSGVVMTSGNLASKTSTLGVADAADITITSVSGSQITQIAIGKDTGTGSTSPLFLYLDTATNLPVTPNGGDIQVQWDNGSNKIFALCQGLGERDRIRFWEWLSDKLGWTGPAELDRYGLYIPAPRFILHDPTPAQAMRHALYLAKCLPNSGGALQLA